MKKQSMKGLTRQQKIQFLWDYYRWQILAAVVGLGVLISSVHYLATYREPLLDVVMINASPAFSEEEPFRDFFRGWDIPYYKGAVELNTRVWLYGDPENNLAASQLLMCSIAAGKTDLFFWDGNAMCPTLGDDVLLDLRDILPESLLQEKQEQLVYTTNTVTGETFPCGLSLEGSTWMENTGYYEQGCVGAAYSADNPELLRNFFMYLLA